MRRPHEHYTNGAAVNLTEGGVPVVRFVTGRGDKSILHDKAAKTVAYEDDRSSLYDSIS